MTSLKSLEALLREATPGLAVRSEIKDDILRTLIVKEEDYDRGVPGSGFGVLAYSIVANTAKGEEECSPESNAAAWVALHNAAPALIAEVRAARRYIYALESVAFHPNTTSEACAEYTAAQVAYKVASKIPEGEEVKT